MNFYHVLSFSAVWIGASGICYFDLTHNGGFVAVIALLIAGGVSNSISKTIK